MSPLNTLHPDNRLRISGIVNDSIVDGPGMRYVVFVQGCYHNCEGCHNKHTHDPLGGKFMSIEDILDEIKKNPLLDGVTFSGGEPFQQAGVLATLGRKIKDYDPNLSIITYSGYIFEHLLKESEKEADGRAGGHTRAGKQRGRTKRGQGEKGQQSAYDRNNGDLHCARRGAGGISVLAAPDVYFRLADQTSSLPRARQQSGGIAYQVGV